MHEMHILNDLNQHYCNSIKMFVMDCKNVTFHIKFNFCMFLDKGMLTFSFIKTCSS